MSFQLYQNGMEVSFYLMLILKQMENSDLENELVKYQPDMIRYAVYLTNDYEYALDIVQDVNYQILKNRDKFESRQYSLKISFVIISKKEFIILVFTYFVNISYNYNYL